LWGISGGFPDRVAVIIEITGIEAGCWMGLFYDWLAMGDESRSWPADSKPQPKVVTPGHKTSTSAGNQSTGKAERGGQGQKNCAISGRLRLYYYA